MKSVVSSIQKDDINGFSYRDIISTGNSTGQGSLVAGQENVLNSPPPFLDGGPGISAPSSVFTEWPNPVMTDEFFPLFDEDENCHEMEPALEHELVLSATQVGVDPFDPWLNHTPNPTGPNDHLFFSTQASELESAFYSDKKLNMGTAEMAADVLLDFVHQNPEWKDLIWKRLRIGFGECMNCD